MKRNIFGAALFCGLLVLAGCGAKSGVGPAAGGPGAGPKVTKGDISDDICQEFTADFIYSATGKTIVKMIPSPLATVHSCEYYTSYSQDYYKLDGGKVMPGGARIMIVLDNLNVERQKEAMKFLDAGVETDPRIKTEHYIVRRSKDKSVWSVDLVINPNRFVWADSSGGALTDDEVIQLAAKMAEKIQGQLSFDIKKNPVDLAAAHEAELGASQEAEARSFFEAVSAGKIEDALKSMEANDQTKAMWKTNFTAVKSLKVTKVEPAFKEEWTSTRQVFKFMLDAKVAAQGEQFGWENGKNFRWLTLEKKGDAWRVTEIANNP